MNDGVVCRGGRGAMEYWNVDQFCRRQLLSAHCTALLSSQDFSQIPVSLRRFVMMIVVVKIFIFTRLYPLTAEKFSLH